MAVAIYKDVAKTILLEDVAFFIGNGTTIRYTVPYRTVAVFINNVKTTKYTTLDGLVKFDYPPDAGVIITLIPENSLNFYLLGNTSGNTIETIFIDTDQDIYLLSENISSGIAGDLQFSLDGITYYSCIEVTTGTDIAVFVKASLASALNEVKTITEVRLIVVDTTTPLDSNGNITVSFTVGGGKYGGVEIHEELI